MRPRDHTVLLGLLMALIAAPTAWAQISDVRVSVEPGDIGLGGVVRLGTWTPMLVTIENRSATVRKVRCQWVLSDIDGDRVQVWRGMALTPQRVGKAWLYAVPPYNMPTSAEWRVQVIDEESGKLLASQKTAAVASLPPDENMIGVTSSKSLDLLRFADNLTQHEKIRFIRGLDPAMLPDRWYGLSGLQALVWTADSTDPDDPSVSTATLKAVRHWVTRGGHLIVVLPSIGNEVWTRSRLSDILPAVEISTVRGVYMPATLGSPKDPVLIDMKVLTPKGDTAVLLTDVEDRPWVVAGQHGFGRVTLIGVDLTDRRLTSRKLPNAPDLWRAVFGWRNKARPQDIKEAKKKGAVRLAEAREMGRIVGPIVAMRDTFTGALMLAIIVFIVYWLAAGPVGFAVLRSRGLTRHAWVGFVAMIVFFSALCWGGASILRPRRGRVAHFSMLDMYAGEDRVHVHSWLSVFVAKHGRVNVAVDPDREERNSSPNTLISAGLPESETESVFLDPRPYDLSATAPDSAAVPYRSTAKQFEVDFLGKLNKADATSREDPEWIGPQSYRLRLVDGFPQGKVSHALPGTLHDVLIVYCPGDGREPWVWTHDTWAAGEILQVRGPTVDKPFHPLAKETLDEDDRWDGYLAERIRVNKPGERLAQGDVGRIVLGDNEIVVNSEVLTFYSMLPPPRYWDEGWQGPIHYYRALGRQLDLTALLKLRRLIIIGYLKDSPLPVPLTIDGRRAKGRGWTVVRWISPIP